MPSTIKPAFAVAARNSGSFSVASNALRMAASRSAGHAGRRGIGITDRLAREDHFQHAPVILRFCKVENDRMLQLRMGLQRMLCKKIDPC